jgi:hypothetical protein
MKNKKINMFISSFNQDQFLNVNYISTGTDRMGDQNETEQLLRNLTELSPHTYFIQPTGLSKPILLFGSQ